MKRINISLPSELALTYSKLCKNNGIKFSSRISILIKEDLEEFFKERKLKGGLENN